MENLSALTVKVLRARLEENGLETFGLKAKLVARLEAFQAKATAASLEATAAEDEVEAEEPAITTTTEASVDSGAPENEDAHDVGDEPLRKRQKTEDVPEEAPVEPVVADAPPAVEPEKPKAIEPGPAHVRLRGLPWSTTRAHVVDFFHIEGITEDNVRIAP